MTITTVTVKLLLKDTSEMQKSFTLTCACTVESSISETSTPLHMTAYCGPNDVLIREVSLYMVL